MPWLIAFDDEVCGFDELSHDGDEDFPGLFSGGGEAVGEGSESGVASAGGEGDDGAGARQGADEVEAAGEVGPEADAPSRSAASRALRALRATSWARASSIRSGRLTCSIWVLSRVVRSVACS